GALRHGQRRARAAAEDPAARAAAGVVAGDLDAGEREVAGVADAAAVAGQHLGPALADRDPGDLDRGPRLDVEDALGRAFDEGVLGRRADDRQVIQDVEVAGGVLVVRGTE